MKRFLKIAGAIIVLIIITGMVVFYMFPGAIIEMSNRQAVAAAGLKNQAVDVDGYEANYYISVDMDKDNTLVLLHGMGDERETFLQVAAYLSKHYNLVIPNLQGHGTNERLPDLDYSIYGQAVFLNELLSTIGIDRMHLGGSSMGGHAAATYALLYPDQVESLIIINGAGVELEEITYKKLDQIGSREEFAVLGAKFFYELPDMPGPFLDHLIDKLNSNMEFSNEVLLPSIRNGAYFNLKDSVQSIQSPTLIVWGKHDGIIQFNIAEYLRDNIPQASLYVLDNAAHAPHLERPEEVANAMLEFTNAL